MKCVKLHPARHQSPDPEAFDDDDINETEYKTSIEQHTMIRPRTIGREPGPSIVRHIIAVTPAIPSELLIYRAKGVCQEQTHGHLDGGGYGEGFDGRSRNLADAAPLCLRLRGLNADAPSPGAPYVANKGQGRLFQGLNRNHNKTPPNSVEDAPRRRIRRSHGDDVGNQPQVECVADRRLDDGRGAGTEKDEERLRTRTSRPTFIVIPTPALLKAQGVPPKKVRQTEEAEIEDDVDGKLNGADNVGHIRAVQYSRGRRDSSLNRTAERAECSDTDVVDARVADLGRHEAFGDRLPASHEAMLVMSPRTDWYVSCSHCAKETFVEDLGHDTGAGVHVHGDDERRVDGGNPELGEGAVERGEHGGGKVESNATRELNATAHRCDPVPTSSGALEYSKHAREHTSKAALSPETRRCQGRRSNDAWCCGNDYANANSTPHAAAMPGLALQA
ncbi:hypothetical protein CORC01_10783 [Colletotrichum orchidophilum]|uniref:Uncharacterized protein n=1 Tax=Colletotrichum orchidophilum TaxID=1209926 RepID=A0A1G4AXL4_9PEZI|nr:uncharacterized protein CORC01_10783 [Colletotrichum orchidophilum]OHE93884.1 hypothetical protein CORC01_10783 [Colletotrichum orchidophilum]